MKNPMREETSIHDFVQQVKSVFSFLFSQWVKIFIAVIFGSTIGLLYAFIKPVKFISKVTFAIEEGKSGGGLASLAGQFGFDLGGMSGGGLFSGDNILLFLTSESLCRETLMTTFDDKGEEVLADAYCSAYGLKNKWRKDEKIGEINFAKYKGKKLPRLEDSLMQMIINKKILENELIVTKPDKKASFIIVSTSMRNEKLSLLFTQNLVDIATRRYIESKTKVKQANVDILQRRADSLAAVLNNRTFKAASFQQNLVDINPALRTAAIPSEISSRDKTITATIFSEVVKNLEIARTILNQEMPAIQMVDNSNLPLEKDKVSKLWALVIGGALTGLIYIFSVLLKYWLRGQAI